MNQEAFVLITVLTAVISLVILAFTFFDILRVRRQRVLVRWLLQEAKESMSKAESAQTSTNEWQILRDLIQQRSRINRMLR